ncbi:hypothetical protein FBUS_05160 [Fasciolopsis buskii]|uniref:Spp2/MOS2 G-patch domain-containing protein n=1 Tax=Fasciolopsis buskii TaxID=27845 RepID=A0A8E0VI02_9TREM|nr:hypothetical protein FBUS_05160 [Fasciolopsis buski]
MLNGDDDDDDDDDDGDDGDDDVGGDPQVVGVALKHLVSEIEDVNYDEVPVEKFGLALLAGMGFNPDELKNQKGDIAAPLRPKGLGLGADPRAVQAVKDSAEQTTKEQLMWKVNGLDGDTGRVIVKFTLSKEILPILQPTIRLVSEKEYSQYANCLNQDDVNQYKAEEAEKHRHQRLNDREPSPNSYAGTHVGYHSDGLSKWTSERDRNCEASKRPNTSSQQLAICGSWVRPNLRVKFLDKHYAGGKYYREKLTVLDAQDGGFFRCQTDNGRVLDDIDPRYLQTVVPHSNNVKVMIVDGARSGEMARLINQDPKRDEVDLKTRAGTMIQLSYDQVCAVSDQR